ncbi:MAG: hypothetical protein JNM63_16895, partial [Spirochaetia bacterium]|nr:hypothetical protein [Spirochaetia bacterium]
TKTPAFESFRPEDFRLYEPRNRGDDSLNARRLEVRHKLQAIGEAARAALAKEGLGLERRESLHHPFSVNHMRVVAQWTALFRDAKARRAFAAMVGPDLGKDVDPGNANICFFVSIDDNGLQIGLRVGEGAWYDAQNFIHQLGTEAGRRNCIEAARRAAGFHFRIHDWAQLYPTDSFSRDSIDTILKYYKIGEHRLTCVRVLAKEDPQGCDPLFLQNAVSGLASLAGLYKFMAWSPENNHLLKPGGGFAH